jgi:hypothetical protein
MAGAGPWFAALLLKESDCQARVVGHTYPHEALDALNSETKQQQQQQQQWIMASKVGPFDVWADCLAFVDQWSKQSNVKRGGELYDYYGRLHHLHCWTASCAASAANEYSVGQLKASCIAPKKKYK